MKKLLVIMPLYNDELFVERAIDSILNQTFKNFFLYIINDCSTDESLNKINKYLSNPKVRLINNKKNMGAYYSRNVGLQLLEKEHFDVYTVHDADDFSDSTRFEKLIKYFDDEYILCVEDQELRIGGIPPKWLSSPGEIMLNLAHAFYSKKTFKVLGYFDNSLFGADTEYWHRMLKYISLNPKYKNKTLKDLLYYTQLTEDNLVLRYSGEERDIYFKKHMQEIENMRINEDFYREFFIKT
jgi:glycosyltransferase involved in cell wall biosynthesis